MKKKSFTLMEILITVALVGVLTVIGIPVYRNVVEQAKAKVCESNLKTLHTALEIYLVTNDNLPTVITGLPRRYIREAHKRVLSEKGAWKIELAYFIVGWRQRGVAYAASFLIDELGKGNLGVSTCPVDTTPPSAGGYSYGLNFALSGVTSRAYKNNISDDVLIFADCGGSTFRTTADLASRHRRFRFQNIDYYYQAINKGGAIVTNLSASTP
jgi:type II secretory pathway pseudopilin PulG